MSCPISVSYTHVKSVNESIVNKLFCYVDKIYQDTCTPINLPIRAKDTMWKENGKEIVKKKNRVWSKGRSKEKKP